MESYSLEDPGSKCAAGIPGHWKATVYLFFRATVRSTNRTLWVGGPTSSNACALGAKDHRNGEGAMHTYENTAGEGQGLPC